MRAPAHVRHSTLAHEYNRLQATVGSFGHVLASLDSTGPLTSDNTLRYRVTASDDKDGDFVTHTRRESRFISPYLSWDLTNNARLDLERLEQNIDAPGAGGGLPPLPGCRRGATSSHLKPTPQRANQRHSRLGLPDTDLNFGKLSSKCLYLCHGHA